MPGSEELNAVKEIAANMGAGMGSSITITDDAGSQLLSDLGRSAIQGVSQYVSKKMRSVKVTLKAGYSVLLLPPFNKGTNDVLPYTTEKIHFYQQSKNYRV